VSPAICIEIVGSLEFKAMIRRVRRFPRRTGVELVLADSTRAAAQITREEAHWLELPRGDIVGVRRLSA